MLWYLNIWNIQHSEAIEGPTTARFILALSLPFKRERLLISHPGSLFAVVVERPAWTPQTHDIRTYSQMMFQYVMAFRQTHENTIKNWKQQQEQNQWCTLDELQLKFVPAEGSPTAGLQLPPDGHAIEFLPSEYHNWSQTSGPFALHTPSSASTSALSPMHTMHDWLNIWHQRQISRG